MRKPKPYWKHWALKRNPFGVVDSADDVFESSELGRIMDLLAEAVEEGGIYSVTGERGIGKTTAKNEMLNYLSENRERYAVSLVESMELMRVTLSTVITAIIADLSSEKPKNNIEHRARQLRRLLGELSVRKKVVLIIDEAQRISTDTLEQLKMITEMTWGLKTRLITIILIGQPELNARFQRDEGLNFRVTKYNMSGLTEDEVLQYIDLRCRVAGGNMRDIFDDDVLAYIAEHQHSPLQINHVCSATMRLARRAGDKKVGISMVYACGGIRTPREILRDNKITIKQFATYIHIDHHTVKPALNGDESVLNPEQRARFKQGLQNIARGSNEEITLDRSSQNSVAAS